MADEKTVERVMFSSTELANMIGVTRQHVINLISRGDIKAAKLGTVYRIPKSEVDRIVNGESAPAA
jgi:excisionase family DNA binding protein